MAFWNSWLRFFCCSIRKIGFFLTEFVFSAADFCLALIGAMSQQTSPLETILSAAEPGFGAQSIVPALDDQLFPIYDSIRNFASGIVIDCLYRRSCHIHLLGAFTLGKMKEVN